MQTRRASDIEKPVFIPSKQTDDVVQRLAMIHNNLPAIIQNWKDKVGARA